MKKLFLIFVTLTLLVCLVSCGECEHVDENNDSVCDLCAYDYGHTHTYAQEISIDENEHWYAISCGHSVADKDREAHKDENNDGVCDVCAYDYGHTHEYSESFSHDSLTHWYAASCGHDIEPKDKVAHKDKNNDSICDECAYDYDHTHTYSSEWSSNSSNHWHSVTCGHAVAAADKDIHIDENNDSICDVCSYDYHHVHTYDEKWSYDNDNHWHALTCPHEVEVGSKEPHADENEDGICDVCGKGTVNVAPDGSTMLPEIEF